MPLMRSLDLVRQDVECALRAEADADRKLALRALQSGIEQRSSAIAADFYRACRDLVGPETRGQGRPGSQFFGGVHADDVALGFEVVRALEGFDPVIQGERAFQSHLRQHFASKPAVQTASDLRG